MSTEVAIPASLPYVPAWKFIVPMLRIRAGDFGLATRFMVQQAGAFRTAIGPFSVIIANDPHMVEEVLVKRHKSYRKDRGFEALRRILGNGLLTSEGEFHLRQRRLIQPAFHKQRIASYAECMVAYARALSGRWQDGATVDMAREMNAVTLSIIGKTMFSAEVSGDAGKVADALTTVIRYHEMHAVGFIGWIFERLPLPASRRFRAAMKELDDTINRMIDEHIKSGEDSGDLLSMLLMSRDHDGSRMDISQIHDEAITLFLAGHETTALAMTWTWYLLAQHPEVEARLHEELDRVLPGGRDATAEDVEQLEYTRRVFMESMRLYPPAWGFGREATEAHQLGPHLVRKGQTIVMSPYMMHRMPQWFENPESFDPDRWLPERSAGLPRFAYFPFGGGQRKCIGENFAWMEGILLLATLAQHWTPRIAPGARIGIDPKITLRPKWGMKMILHKRKEN
jgi:cytochrome P450